MGAEYWLPCSEDEISDTTTPKGITAINPWRVCLSALVGLLVITGCGNKRTVTIQYDQQSTGNTQGNVSANSQTGTQGVAQPAIPQATEVPETNLVEASLKPTKDNLQPPKEGTDPRLVSNM